MNGSRWSIDTCDTDMCGVGSLTSEKLDGKKLPSASISLEPAARMNENGYKNGIKTMIN